MTKNKQSTYAPRLLGKTLTRCTNRYLKGLGLKGIQNLPEERAALNAWHWHDAITGVPVTTALVAGFATALEKPGVGTVLFAGAVFAGLIQAFDARRVMANAVLEQRDKPRPALQGHNE